MARDAAQLAAEIRRRLGPPPELPRRPLVSIVVLNRDGVEHLRRLLAGLVERTDYPELELIVVDNASSDESLDYVRAVEAPFPISIIANPHNESFSDACNQGAELASGELLLFLNNDAEPFESGWLRELVSCLLDSPAVAAGPTLVEQHDDAPGGYAVHQRGLRAREENAVLVTAYRHRHADPLGDGVEGDDEVIAVAAACLLIDRGAFERVGGFTRGYWYGPEDVDLCLKLRERGMSVRCSGRSALFHRASSTLDRIGTEQRREWVRGNRRLFGRLWGPRLRREFELDRLRGDGLWSEPESGRGSRGATVEQLEALGFCVLWAGAPGDGQERDEGATAASVAALVAALRDRGRHALALSGSAADRLESFERDVVVHREGYWRHTPRPARINVLWSTGDPTPGPDPQGEHYDLILSGDPTPGEAPESLAERLIEACARHAELTGFKTRIEPSPEGF